MTIYSNVVKFALKHFIQSVLNINNTMFFSALYELLMFVHIILSSVLVDEWPPFGKKLLTWAYVLFEV